MKKIKQYLVITILLACALNLSGCYMFGSCFTGAREERVLMETTGYCPCGKCCGYERSCFSCFLVPYTPNGRVKKIGITSSGKKAKRGTIAADTSYYPYGTKMHIPGYGWGEVQDTGGAIKGATRIDLFFKTHAEALKWGRKKVLVTVIKP